MGVRRVPTAPGPQTRRLLQAVLDAWPQHAAFLARHFERPEGVDPMAEALADLILKLVGPDLDQVAGDYAWMCRLFLKAQLDYRRARGVAYGDTAAIRAAFYDNAVDMRRYMNGLLVSQVTWPQHLGAQIVFRDVFLARLAPGYGYLEVGPGHGVTLALVAADPNSGSLTGCDISSTSLEMTRAALDRLGVKRPVDLRQCDICAIEKPLGSFDAIGVSQVLELVSSPESAIRELGGMLKPGGRLFVNAPVRMIAPDHLRVWQDGSEVDTLLRSAGLAVEDSAKAPAAGVGGSLEQGYSYLVVGRRPG
jgi:2-polyprenyl-3-methyl-5-hydroxy-6-metoxy-1,4-benzoquinol methylase